MIPTPVDFQRDTITEKNGRGWWLFFKEPDYWYPTAYYVAEEGEVERSNPSNAPMSITQVPPTWREPVILTDAQHNASEAFRRAWGL